MTTAPVVIIPCSSKAAYLRRYAEDDKGWTDQDEARWPVPFWHMDAAMASLLILLTAVDEGLGACFFGIPPEYERATRDGVRHPRRLRPGRRDHARSPAARRGAVRLPDEAAAQGPGGRRAPRDLEVGGGRDGLTRVHSSDPGVRGQRATRLTPSRIREGRASRSSAAVGEWDARPVSDGPGESLSFPRHRARTRNFTLGRPRSVTVAADGSRVVFLRSAGGTDPVNALWVLDVDGRRERLVADPARLLEAGDDDVPPEERARRERMREVAGGIVGYDVDASAGKASFALAGRLFLADLVYGGATELSTAGPVIDPRVDPSGSRVAYVSGGALHVVETDGTDGRLLIGEDTDDVTWGAGRVRRRRGDGPRARLLVGPRRAAAPRRAGRRVVGAALAHRRPRTSRAAGDGDALPGGGHAERRRHRGDRRTRRLAARRRVGHRRPALSRRRRLARRARAVRRGPEPRPASPAGAPGRPRTGRRRSCARTPIPHWVDINAGVPVWLADGRLVWLADLDDTRRLWVGDEVVTPEGLQVSTVAGVGDDWVLLEAGDESTERHLYRWSESAGLRAPDHRARPVPRARRRRPPRGGVGHPRPGRHLMDDQSRRRRAHQARLVRGRPGAAPGAAAAPDRPA